jgi:hypothetical protein
MVSVVSKSNKYLPALMFDVLAAARDMVISPFAALVIWHTREAVALAE